jgi:tellurite resistance protein TehA-like permease
MSIVAVAILISFHLKAEASALEKRIALPFGLVFWVLAIACLAAGLNNYIKTVSRYSRRQALVQSGTGTQLVSGIVITMRDAGSSRCPRAMLM